MAHKNSLWCVKELCGHKEKNAYLVTDIAADVSTVEFSFEVLNSRKHSSEARGEHFYDGYLSIHDKNICAQIPFQHLILRKDGFVQVAYPDDYVQTFLPEEIYLELKLLSV
ncbi:hypothetical protein [Shimazuella alba]|uniref:Uncharacterized protein n=1 Tax=Shimazuella alba TaxID=2690964 RepID=A0A6I4VW85_9BACL|nr:hypothetical protein [Shimazuella alba]MXQ52262.1 hypothetical protein [Shimazuella alba]